METFVEGSKEQFKAFMDASIEGPIRMLNLLKYKPDGGSKKYAQYAAHTAPLLEKCGGKVIFQADARLTVIGPEDWDKMLIVEYPNRAAFFSMVLSEEYQKGVHLRHEALEDSRLVCMQSEKNHD